MKTSSNGGKVYRYNIELNRKSHPSAMEDLLWIQEKLGEQLGIKSSKAYITATALRKYRLMLERNIFLE
jgi:hypothetical protein